MGHWFRLNKYNDMIAHTFDDGAAYRAFCSVGLISDDQDNTEQMNETLEELKGSFLRNISELLSDYLSEKHKWKNFSRYWSANKFNYAKIFDQSFIDSRGSEIIERFFKKGPNVWWVLNDELKEQFNNVYDSFNKGPKDVQKTTTYGKNDQDFLFFRDSQFNTGGPSTGLLGTSNQNIGDKEPMSIQFPMSKIPNATTTR